MSHILEILNEVQRINQHFYIQIFFSKSFLLRFSYEINVKFSLEIFLTLLLVGKLSVLVHYMVSNKSS